MLAWLAKEAKRAKFREGEEEEEGGERNNEYR
jgi:hypothetical protein